VSIITLVIPKNEKNIPKSLKINLRAIDFCKSFIFIYLNIRYILPLEVHNNCLFSYSLTLKLLPAIYDFRMFFARGL